MRPGPAILLNVIERYAARRHEANIALIGPPVKLTPRQAEVIANLTRVTTDGSRHEPMFWLGGKNVSVQVRSLLANGFVELQDGLLVKIEQPTGEAQRPAFDPNAAVRAMRELLSERSGS